MTKTANNKWLTGARFFMACLLPLSAHMAIVSGRPVIATGFILCLIVLLLARKWSQLVYLLPGAVAVFFYIKTGADSSLLVLYAWPTVIFGTLATVFAKSLTGDNIPMITRYSLLIHRRISPVYKTYTRRLTLVWSVFFTLMMIQSVLLAFFAPIEIWSLFANVLNYIAVALLFVGEYLYRRQHLPDMEHPSFPRFLKMVIQARPNANQ